MGNNYHFVYEFSFFSTGNLYELAEFISNFNLICFNTMLTAYIINIPLTRSVTEPAPQNSITNWNYKKFYLWDNNNNSQV